MTDKQLLIIAKGFTKGILNGGKSLNKCFMVTWPLQGYLSSMGYETKMIEGEIKTPYGVHQHYWLKLTDGRILDPTADQFNTQLNIKMPKVYLGKKPDWYNPLTNPELN